MVQFIEKCYLDMIWENEFCFKVEIYHDVVYKEKKKLVNLFLSKNLQFWKQEIFQYKPKSIW